MTDPAPRKPERVATHAVVVRTERLTPHMIRVVLGGEGLDGFDPGPYTDRYVKLLFPAAAGPEGRVPMRTYTIRSWDPAARELAIDFVAHGDEGLAGPWASAARPGDAMSFVGPGGDYAPSGSYDWHLLVGDESALPAIAAALEAMRPRRDRGRLGRRGTGSHLARSPRPALGAPRRAPGARSR